jgi:hypothetical protein
MRAFFLAMAAIVILLSNEACKSSSSPKTFCDTTCLQDTIRFTGDHALAPYIYISPKDCGAGSITRGHKALGANLTIAFDYPEMKINKDYMRCLFNDTTCAYLLFNNCETGRGYWIKLPFNKTGSLTKIKSGINNIDPKFAVDNDMVAYTDRGNIFVEQVSSGKKAMMTFGKGLDIDYDAIHEYIDSVNVSPDRIWVKIKIDEKWTELEKKITLE